MTIATQIAHWMMTGIPMVVWIRRTEIWREPQVKENLRGIRISLQKNMIECILQRSGIAIFLEFVFEVLTVYSIWSQDLKVSNCNIYQKLLAPREHDYYGFYMYLQMGTLKVN
jgi:hypothetical protein